MNLQVTPAFYCSSGNLNQVYIYFHLVGSVIDGEFLPISAYGSRCMEYLIDRELQMRLPPGAARLRELAILPSRDGWLIVLEKLNSG